MANTFEGGAAVRSGYYYNAARWAVEPIAKDGDRLPEGEGTWMRVPTVVALGAVPLVGLGFLMALPFIGFALTAKALATPAIRLFHRSAEDLAATVSPGWQPGEAHLTGKRAENAEVEEKGPPSAAGERLEALEKEIEAKREDKA
jgi:hypothetical protein